MCYETKKKIADCVKSMAGHKAINRITIHDIMNETGMSRQSFYYHFKDIYDVLEWIEKNDIEHALMGENYDNLSDWICALLAILRKDHIFYEKLVEEIPWPKIQKSMQAPISEQVTKIFQKYNSLEMSRHQAEWDSCINIFTISFSYYLMDLVYSRRKVTDAVVLGELNFLTKNLASSEHEAKITAFPVPAAAKMRALG